MVYKDATDEPLVNWRGVNAYIHEDLANFLEVVLYKYLTKYTIVQQGDHIAVEWPPTRQSGSHMSRMCVAILFYIINLIS